MINRQDLNKLDAVSPEAEVQNHRFTSLEGEFYEIRVKGQIPSEWTDWLEGLEVKFLENGEMLLVGQIIDQAALMGVLNKISCLNLALRSVNCVKADKIIGENHE